MKSVILTALTAALMATSAYAGSGGAVGSARAAQSGIVGRMAQAEGRGDGGRVERQERVAPAQAPGRQGGRQDGHQRREGPRQGPGPAANAVQAGPPNGAWQGRRDGGRPRPAPGVVAPEPPRVVTPQAPPNTVRQRDRDVNRDGNRNRDWDGRRGGGDWNNAGRDRGDWNNDGNRRGEQWDRNRRDRDHGRRGYEARRWPQYVQPRQTYRWYGPVWIDPPGYSYRSYSYGQRLPSQWFAPRYYLNDYWRYGLPTPPIGFEWVRLGPDVVLVDVFDGRVYQVVRNLFW